MAPFRQASMHVCHERVGLPGLLQSDGQWVRGTVTITEIHPSLFPMQHRQTFKKKWRHCLHSRSSSAPCMVNSHQCRAENASPRRNPRVGKSEFLRRLPSMGLLCAVCTSSRPRSIDCHPKHPRRRLKTNATTTSKNTNG